jgi:hypothetical protein
MLRFRDLGIISNVKKQGYKVTPDLLLKNVSK